MSEYLRVQADNKVAICECNEELINRAIEDGAQVGWRVQQIAYIKHSGQIAILFERSDVPRRIKVDNIGELEIPF